MKVMIFGTFDIVHMGHIHMFEQACEYGDKLIAVVARDKNVEKIKGIGAMHADTERVKFLEHIKLIDHVVLGDLDNPYQSIIIHKPDIIALGYDQKVYVNGIADVLTKNGLEAQIVRLSPYQAHKFKSDKIKKYIERVV